MILEIGILIKTKKIRLNSQFAQTTWGMLGAVGLSVGVMWGVVCLSMIVGVMLENSKCSVMLWDR